MENAERRDWIDLQGLTLDRLEYADGFVRLRLSDGSFVDVGVDDAFDENEMRLTGASDLPAAA